MSILGYSAAYFFPEYWSSTPLYGEKIIPLIDYILSADYEKADTLANAFYMMENKYKNTGDLPLECIKEIINESGYAYVLDLLGTDEQSIRLLTYLLVMVNQLKGTGLGIEVVLNLLKRDTDPMKLVVIGNPRIDSGFVSDFSVNDYVYYEGFTTNSNAFEITFPIRTGAIGAEQVIASVAEHGLYLSINSQGRLVLMLGSKGSDNWDIIDRTTGTTAGSLAPNTTYYIKLEYDGYGYFLKVSRDNEKFTDYLAIENSASLDFHKERLYLGIGNNTGTPESPFMGSLDLNPFSTNVNNIKVTQWFETLPVGAENTFQVKADLDLGVVSSDFFQKFSTFVKKYVYPTLTAFEANLGLQNNVTFLPYVREKITYVASADVQQQAEDYLNSKG